VDESWTVLKVLEWTTSRFERAGLESARLEAQVLLAHVLDCNRVALYTSYDRPLDKSELGSYRALIQRRLAGEPVAYLVGQQEFWSRPFAVDARVLVPRRDTETLIEAVLERIADRNRELDIADIGTGSGIIAITLAAELPRARVVATDISADALAVARANVGAHDLGDRVELRKGDLLAPLGPERFDVIVANLPYVPEGDLEQLQVELRAEPRGALVSGADGLTHLRRLATDLKQNLKESGFIALEHGFDQGPAVRALVDGAGLGPAHTCRDLGGHERVTIGTMPGRA